jgi:hypothetical protein
MSRLIARRLKRQKIKRKFMNNWKETTLKPDISGEKIKSSVNYRILIKSGEVFYKIGTIVIKTHEGDIFYTPSNRSTLKKDEIDHISWHINGQVHIKKTNNIEKYQIVQKNGERQKLSEMGFQEMIKDFIEDYKKLPIYKKNVIPLDVVFDINNYAGQVCFNFSIVSGKLIMAGFRGQKVPIIQKNIKKTGDGIGVVQRALGWHSGNADVMLQYFLGKSANKDLVTNRKLFIPNDMKISKMNIKL